MCRGTNCSQFFWSKIQFFKGIWAKAGLQLKASKKKCTTTEVHYVIKQSIIVKPVQHSVIWGTEWGKNEFKSEENCVQFDSFGSILKIDFAEKRKEIKMHPNFSTQKNHSFVIKTVQIWNVLEPSMMKRMICKLTAVDKLVEIRKVFKLSKQSIKTGWIVTCILYVQEHCFFVELLHNSNNWDPYMRKQKTLGTNSVLSCQK